MIVVEERLIKTFDQLPEMDGFKPIYKWGNEDHLIQQMSLYSKENKSIYPLIYQTSKGSDQDDIAKECKTDLFFILACRNPDITLTNENRWAMSYGNILFPLVENMQKCFHRAGIFNWDGKLRIDEFPNYSEIKKGQKIIDIWDALTVKLHVTINDRNINKIRF